MRLVIRLFGSINGFAALGTAALCITVQPRSAAGTPAARRTARPFRRCLPLSTLALLACSTTCNVLANEDLDILLDGVAEIGRPGAPGALCVYGTDSRPVIAGVVPGDAQTPVAAAGRWDAGRVVAIGHDGYFDRPTLESADTGRFMRNALHWAAGRETPLARTRVGVVRSDGLRTWLVDAGIDAVEVSLTPESLSAVDVVASVMWNQTASEIEALSFYLRAGGGLVTASTGWGWAQLHPDRDLVEDYAGNRLLANVGIGWFYGFAQGTSPFGYSADSPPDALTHAVAAIDAVEAYRNGERTMDGKERSQAVATLEGAVRCLPRNENTLAPRLRALVAEAEENDRWPSADNPVGRDDLVARIAATVFVLDHARTSAASVRAHPVAADFPGAIPPDAGRITRRITIDTTIPRWHSTGLYAGPGELVTVTVPDVVAEAGGWHVRVGAHTDAIWGQAEWRRMPEISRRFAVSAPTTAVANAFGGLVYVEVPPETNLGTVDVEIDGAVAAPLFVMGETDPAEWREKVRHAPAPWAEIAGRNMVVTTDAREVRDLDNPMAVAEVWDRVLDLDAELAGWPVPRRHPERFVVDRQLSGGYMHAGYPMMAHLDQQANLVDATHLRTCRYEPTQSNWGFFHEAGHLHQSSHWTFDGTTEVTVNLFTLYVYEFLCGIRVAENWRGSSAFRADKMSLYDFDDPDFEHWKRDPFLALAMYEQLQQGFGWGAFREVFHDYRRATADELPRTDDEKRDQWLMRFSHTVARNLGPFFEAWGVPTSQATRDAIADLPVWLPAEHQPAHRAVRLGDLDADGRADVLLRHLDGRWFLYPMNGRRHTAGRGSADLPADRAWTFAGVGDFDGVEGDEVLLRHTDGRWRHYPMAGREQRGRPTEISLPRSRGYRLAAVGDLNGDGRDDVLLRHTRGHWRYCPMVGGRPVPGGCDAARIAGNLLYRFEGVGDFDGDGNVDVLLRIGGRQTGSSEVAPKGRPDGSWLYYPMNGRENTGPRMWTDLPTNRLWRLAAVGDFDGDGTDDVLLRHHGNGRWHFYRSAPGARTGSGFARLTRDAAYRIAAVGDLDGDGKDDILLRRNDGPWPYYAMDGSRVKNQGWAALTRNMAWRVARR